MKPNISQLIEEWNLTGLSPEQQSDIIEKVGALVYHGVLTRASTLLSDIDKVEFELMMQEETQDPSHILIFLEKKIPNFNAVVQEETQKVKSKIFPK